MAEQQLQLTVKNLFARDEVRNKFQELLGKRAPAFITSVLQTVSQNDMLTKAEPTSIYHSAAVAATLDLPLNGSLGFAYIVPYNQKQQDGSYRQVAQFQMGYKGFIQLAQRSGTYKTINATDVRQGEIKRHDRLTGEIEFEWEQNEEIREKLPVIGYAAFFELLNGFKKTTYKTVAELRGHGQKYSKTFSKTGSLWNQSFESMATKTVLKLLISKYGPQSIDMQRAIITDQAVINDADTVDVTYVDNDGEKEDIDLEDLQFLFDSKKSLLSPDEIQNAERILSKKEENSYSKLHKLLQSK
jgi:recombination protein RecT